MPRRRSWRGVRLQLYQKRTFDPGLSSYDRTKKHRRFIRLKDYDYCQPGAYFVTTVTRDRACVLGEVVDGAMKLNEYGRIIQAVWDDLPKHYTGIECDAFIVMPNHIHGIIVLIDVSVQGAKNFSPLPKLWVQSKTHIIGAASDYKGSTIRRPARIFSPPARTNAFVCSARWWKTRCD